MSQAEEPVVVHVDDIGNGEVVADEKTTCNSMRFDSKDFSIYVVVDGVTKYLTVQFMSGTTDCHICGFR